MEDESRSAWSDPIINSGLFELLKPFHREGIYLLCLGDDLLYIGQSIQVHSRLKQHAVDKTFDRVFFYDAQRRRTRMASALAFEQFLIHRWEPKLNTRRASGDRLVELFYQLPHEVGMVLIETMPDFSTPGLSHEATQLVAQP